ncbi:MAG TPA: hypothetical protein EYH01_09765 [Campylobacterales bacterium]|nr:hypothetical protein [Campylobacterales bacterium]
MSNENDSNINGFTAENIVENLTGIILISIAIYAFDALPSGENLFSTRSIPMWLIILVLTYKGVYMIFQANKDQKTRSKNNKENI